MLHARSPPTALGKRIREIADEHGELVRCNWGNVIFMRRVSAKSAVWKDIEKCIHEHAIDTQVELMYYIYNKGAFTKCATCESQFKEAIAARLKRIRSQRGRDPAKGHHVTYKSMSKMVQLCARLLSDPTRPPAHADCKNADRIKKNSYVATLRLNFERVHLAVDYFTEKELPSIS